MHLSLVLVTRIYRILNTIGTAINVKVDIARSQYLHLDGEGAPGVMVQGLISGAVRKCRNVAITGQWKGINGTMLLTCL